MCDRTEAKVLVVDDEADICFLFGRILRKRNLQTDYARNLEEARQFIQKAPPSLIFLDNCLPDGEGTDIIPFIKAHSPETQVIMITAHDSLIDKNKAFNQGADDFLGKPLSLASINHTLDKLSEMPGTV